MFIPDDDFKLILDSVPIICVDILPFGDNWTQVLLAKRNFEPNKGQWRSTGGRVLKRESIEEAAVRQARQELGIDINFDKMIFGGVISEVWDNSIYEGVGYHAITIYYGFLLEQEASIHIDNQHSEYRWFDNTDPNIEPEIQERVQNITNKLSIDI